MSPSRLLLPLILALPGLLCAADAVEQPKDMRDNAKDPFAATGEDITRLPTTFGFAYDSIVNDSLKSNTDKFLVTGSFSLLGLQAEAEVPMLVRQNPGIGQTTDGFGDVFLSGSFALPLNPKLRVSAGLDATLDTASRDELGAGENVWTPFLGVATQLEEKDLVVGKFSYTNGQDSDLERWDLMIRGVHRWTDQLFTSAEVTPGWNVPAEDFTLRFRALAGAQVDRHTVVSIETGQPLDSNTRDTSGWDIRVNYGFLF